MNETIEYFTYLLAMADIKEEDMYVMILSLKSENNIMCFVVQPALINDEYNDFAERLVSDTRTTFPSITYIKKETEDILWNFFSPDRPAICFNIENFEVPYDEQFELWRRLQ